MGRLRSVDVYVSCLCATLVIKKNTELPTQSVHILLQNGGPTKGDDGNANMVTSPHYKSNN